MIVLDTHIWALWVQGGSKLAATHAQLIKDHEEDGLGISAISMWEVAKLVELDRLALPVPLDEWVAEALAYPGMILLGLTAEISIESTQLPGAIHRDPADQIIVATARIHDCPLLTIDQRLIDYPHVATPPS